MHSRYAIEVKGLSVSYDKKRVLSNIFLNILPGKTIGVVGPNGAGKSTLFKSILGLTAINAGTVQILGEDLEKVRKRVAYIPQKDDVDWDFPAIVQDIVMMGRYPHRKIWQRLDAEDKEITKNALIELGILDLKNRQIGALSGGQQQRVFIARALAQQADMIFMDEPFVGVDITTEQKIIDIIRKQAALGKTILVVHHDLSTVPDYFDQVIMLNQRLIAYGDTQDIFTSANISRTYAPQLKILQDIGLEEGKH
jgi:ABC-type Mn2+/Zn2+ transport system ATPase subunit